MLICEIFGQQALNKLKIGDIVSWSELSDTNSNIVFPQMGKRFGFVSKIEIVNRGNRKVGIVKVIPMGSTIEKEVLAVCISLVSQQQIHDI